MNADPGSDFPWDEVLFYVPEWIPPVIRQHILRRIETTEHVQWAHAIISHRGETSAQRRELQRLPNVRAKETFILYPDWLARVYFSGLIVDTPRYLVWKDQNPLIAMSDLGDGDANLKTMVALERYGAIVVPLKHAHVLCVADDSPLLGMPEDDIPPQLDHVRFMPVARFHQLRGWARVTFFERQREIEEEEEEDLIEEEMRRAARREKRALAKPAKYSRKKLTAAPPKPARAAPAPAAAPARPARPAEPAEPARPRRPGSIGLNNESWQTRLSEKERRLLAIWLAHHCPDGKGRTSIKLFKALRTHEFDDPGWTELARRRSASAWRDWYRKFYKMAFPDGRSFGDHVEEWVLDADGMDLDDALGPYAEAGNSQDGNAPRKRMASSLERPERPERPVQRRRKLETPASSSRKVRTRSSMGTPSTLKKRRQLVVEIPVRRPSIRPA